MTTPDLQALIELLAQEIRRVDGSHTLGASELAEALVPFIQATAPTLPGAGGGDALDARRYRWLRDNDMFDPASQPPELARAFSRYTGSALDAAIDAAMTPQQGG